jgi:hypothetical protein
MKDLTETIIEYVDKDGPIIRTLELRLHKAASSLVGKEKIFKLEERAGPIP